MIEFWIGNEIADYNGDAEAQYSITDIKEIGSGNLNTSYDIDLPNTEKNIRLLKYITQLSSTEEQNATSRIVIDGVEIIKGSLVILSITKDFTKVFVSVDDWMDAFKKVTLQDLDLSAYNEIYNGTNVVASWTAAAGAFFRYPLISHGKPDYYIANNYNLNSYFHTDFAPWFNVKKILEKIFSGYTISSTFINSAYFNTLYISCNEPKAESSFLDDTRVYAKVANTTDNYISDTVPAGGGQTTTLDAGPVLINNEIEDDNNNWTGEKYTINTAGTYRFIFDCQVSAEHVSLDIDSQSYTYRIIRTPLVGSPENIVEYTGTTDPVNKILDTGYKHFEAGDEVTCYVNVVITSTNNTAFPQNVIIYVKTESEFESVADLRCLLIGTGYNIEPAKFLHEWTQIDFIGAIKQMFNLNIWLDSWSKTIYIEPQPTFNTTEVINITNLIDYSDIDIQLISSNYGSKIRLMYSDDEKDTILRNYNNNNVLNKGEKLITLTSLFAKNEIEEIKNKLSTFIIGHNPFAVTPDIPKIWGGDDADITNYAQMREVPINHKIATWDGMTTTGLTSWIYEDVTKTTYPKISAIDFGTIYATYFAKTFHLIDKGKIVTLNGLTDPLFVAQLNTVINDSTKEGFRPLFKFLYQNEYHYGILNRYSLNGSNCKYELTLII